MQCAYCRREMTEADSCIMRAMSVGGEIRALTKYGNYHPHRCHDCNVIPGGWHHPGCSAQRCPACGGQFISCECW